MRSEREHWTNIPLSHEVHRGLEGEADRNGRSVAREGEAIITREIRRKMARRAAK